MTAITKLSNQKNCANSAAVETLCPMFHLPLKTACAEEWSNFAVDNDCKTHWLRHSAIYAHHFLYH